MSVGITSLIDTAFLAAVSGESGSTSGRAAQRGREFFTAPGFTALQTMYDIVSAGVCRAPSIEEEPEGEARGQTAFGVFCLHHKSICKVPLCGNKKLEDPFPSKKKLEELYIFGFTCGHYTAAHCTCVGALR